ncbi:protein of unknown function [Salinimicrobium catena]|uniref:DUF4136 domain-containing protein n=1 Tax=Salinimicrobium catena TaxID=390640 RepID=A0A1H5NIZ1_9FLAO|nr:DUF4136 domain-containing protein [Salinimicrobium catena]SDL47930.1 protein of unknown function [Salinimicrobium catena]SEF01545.1 protein of unknown function [Salinimicrobium catena]
MKFIPFLLFFLILTSCNAPQAVYDYDQQINFSQYQTFDIYPDLRTGLSQLDEERLIKSARHQLQNKSLSHSTNPDLYLNIYSEEYRQQSDSRLGIGVGGGSRNVGVGVSGGIPLGGPETYLRLTFDLIDAKTDALVWQAVVESSFDLNASPTERQKRFDQIVQKALAGYPPKR